jgi:uncharacterized protein (UPF0216 family)
MTGSISEEGVLRKLLQHMNSQVPSKRMRLGELLAMPEPHYVGRDGGEYAISKEELKLIKEALDLLGVDDIKLPIVIMADSSHEQSAWRVEGENECALVLLLLGKSGPETKSRIFLYAPHVAALRRKVPTATVCMLVP